MDAAGADEIWPYKRENRYLQLCYDYLRGYPFHYPYISYLNSPQIFSGAPPFENTPDMLLFTVVGQGYRPLRLEDDMSLERGLDDTLWSLMEKSWDQDPICRPSAHELKAQLRPSCPVQPKLS